MGGRRSSSTKGPTDAWAVIPEWWRYKTYGTGRGVYVHLDVDPNQWLYRYMRGDAAVNMLKRKVMWFANPRRCWDDPHETWWYEQLFGKANFDNVDANPLGTAHAYGSCWTTRWRDEPFWRFYTCTCIEGADVKTLQERAGAPLRPPIRFRIRASALRDWLCELIEGGANAKAFLGRVRYCPIDQLADKAYQLRHVPKGNRVATLAADALRMKRLAFEFESEVRMLWIERGGEQVGLELPFRTELFDQVMLGPSTDRKALLQLQRELVDAGLDPALIVPSSIANPPLPRHASRRGSAVS